MISPFLIAAASSSGGGGALATIQTRLTDIMIVIINTYLLPLGGSLIIIAIILAGLRYIQGDAKGGKTALIAAVTGLAIVLLAYVLLGQVCKTLGTSCFT